MSDRNDDYWSEEDDPYIDPSAQILKNIPGFTTQTQLDTYESLVFQVNFPEALAWALESDMDFALWKTVHKICFKDVYSWAGSIRTIRISKGTTVFAYPEHIEREATKIFDQYNALSSSETLTLADIANIIGELNVIHPFREGNGRTLRVLLEAMCNKTGYNIDYELTDQEEQIAAFIKSYKGDNSYLEALLQKITKPQ